MKKGDTKGQFYLIATIIIVVVIIGFAVITNYSFKKSSSKLEAIGEELKIEGEKVLDYDTVNEPDEFENFAKDYSEYIGDEIDIYFIVGEGTSFEAYEYDGESKNDLSANLVVGSNIVFTLEEVDYEFDLEQGKNFYFIITQKIRGEKYVVTN